MCLFIEGMMMRVFVKCGCDVGCVCEMCGRDDARVCEMCGCDDPCVY